MAKIYQPTKLKTCRIKIIKHLRSIRITQILLCFYLNNYMAITNKIRDIILLYRKSFIRKCNTFLSFERNVAQFELSF